MFSYFNFTSLCTFIYQNVSHAEDQHSWRLLFRIVFFRLLKWEGVHKTGVMYVFSFSEWFFPRFCFILDLIRVTFKYANNYRNVFDQFVR